MILPTTDSFSSGVMENVVMWKRPVSLLDKRFSPSCKDWPYSNGGWISPSQRWLIDHPYYLRSLTFVHLTVMGVSPWALHFSSANSSPLATLVTSERSPFSNMILGGTENVRQLNQAFFTLFLLFWVLKTKSLSLQCFGRSDVGIGIM